jgi:hypothetical protein
MPRDGVLELDEFGIAWSNVVCYGRGEEIMDILATGTVSEHHLCGLREPCDKIVKCFQAGL